MKYSTAASTPEPNTDQAEDTGDEYHSIIDNSEKPKGKNYDIVVF